MQKILIANRGEIAVRIARTLEGMGIPTVGIFADADHHAVHSRFMSENVFIGEPGGNVDAYLDLDAIVSVATETGCDAIHPGYGFLSENADFAQRCADSDIAFIGPSADALRLFGDKIQARNLARSLYIPVVPGSDTSIGSVTEALSLASHIGYPVMLKAAAGGGGRGMRAVASESEMGEAFERCRSEAMAAFGDGTVFIERQVVRPRHVEVQVLGDKTGKITHLFERDCSVQLRNQKVLEVAPALGLSDDLLGQLRRDALKLAEAAKLTSAATVEFLIDTELDTYYFIECNPRIQVEHTVTEAITGVDLVEAQVEIARGTTLAELGLADGPATARGIAIQARVVMQGGGQVTAWREPTGAGIRVDGACYAGYVPPTQFDPLLAKLICHVDGRAGPAVLWPRVLTRLRQAIGEFHVAGIQTNLGQLAAIVDSDAFRSGDARTTLLAENPDVALTNTVSSPLVELFDSQAPDVGDGFLATGLPDLPVRTGEEAVFAPLPSAIVEVLVSVGDAVAAGQTLAVVSAMKMETQVTAPVTGTVCAMQDLTEGASVTDQTMLFVIAPGDVDVESPAPAEETEGWQQTLDDVGELKRLAVERLEQGSEEPDVVRQRMRGKLTCRERVDLLLDRGSFREVGSIAGFASYDEDGGIAGFTPANSVGGTGRLSGRDVVVCADDFTSRGGHADGAIGAKSGYLDRLALEMQVPSIRMLDGSSGGGSVAAMVPQQKKEGESQARESDGAIKSGRPRVTGGGGSFLPGHLGSTMYAEQLSTIPVVNMLLGSVVGIGAAKAVLGHFSVMVRDIAQLFVAGPPVVSHAMGYEISKEDLGGWHIHCQNGSVDNLAESEEEACDMARRFLSYLPPSVFDAPPVVATTDPAGRREEALMSLIGRKRTTTFDIRRGIELIADRGSFFEMGPLWGTDQVTGFIRMNGYPMGVIASDSRHVNGGALTADGCDKLTRHLDLCDLFHLPVLNLVDNPGFAVGVEHEEAGTIRRGGAWMVAFAQTQVPVFTVVMRRSFGVAGNNYATPRSGVSARVTWPAADVGGIPPEGGIEAAYKRQLAEAEDPVALRAELNARIESARGPVGPLNRFQMEEMIDPRDTRRYVCEWVANAYRVATQPARLRSRDIAFRP